MEDQHSRNECHPFVAKIVDSSGLQGTDHGRNLGTTLYMVKMIIKKNSRREVIVDLPQLSL